MSITGQITNTASSLPLLNIPQRIPDETEIENRNQDNLSRKIRVGMPCEVVSFDPDKQTVTVQPLIREKVINRQDGSINWVQLPQLVDVPVAFPQGGPFCLTMPIKPGDEVKVSFLDTCIDGWWASGGIQNWMDRRRHDLSDGICEVGINSQPNVIPNISETAAELRSKDGNVKVSLNRDATLGDSITIESGANDIFGPAKVVMDHQSLTFDSVPTPFPHIALTANTSVIEFKKTVYTVLGVPTLIDTLVLTGPQIIMNGVPSIPST